MSFAIESFAFLDFRAVRFWWFHFALSLEIRCCFFFFLVYYGFGVLFV